MTRRALMLVSLLAISGAGAAQEPGGGNCPASFQMPPRPTPAGAPEAGYAYLNADETLLAEDGVSHLQGNVELTLDGGQQARADEAFYDNARNNARLFGDVKIWSDAAFINSDNAAVEFDNNTARFKTARYYLPQNYGARGRARDLFIEMETLTVGERAAYTTCAAAGLEKNAWTITATSMTLNHKSEQGKAKNVVLKIKGVPIFYTPYLNFPLGERRKSGFLAPGFGKAGDYGFEARLPYYWNMAPNMDLTVTPRTFTSGDVMGLFEYRYLAGAGRGRLNFEYLPGDDRYGGRDRSLAQFEHAHRFLENGRLFLEYRRASDLEYLEDFGSYLGIAGTRYLSRQARLDYQGDDWSLAVHAQTFQLIDRGADFNTRPYKRLPQVRLNYSPWSEANALNLEVASEFTHFDRGGDRSGEKDVTGLRSDFAASLSYPMRSAAAFLVPKAGVRHTRYNLFHQGPFAKSPERTLPLVSLDGGLFLERFARVGERDYLHTLEPRMYYLYIPHKDQSHLPAFDTGVYNPSARSYFRENRFSGKDRIGDANRVVLSLGSRLLDRNTGREAAFIQVVQSFFLEDQDVTAQQLSSQGRLVDSETPNDDLLSPVVVEAGAAPAADLRLRGEVTYDPSNNITREIQLAAQYNPADRRVLNLAYRVRRAAGGRIQRNDQDAKQTDLSFSWPLGGRLNAVGRWNYAISEKRSLDLFFGLEYQGCCFSVRGVGRRFLTNLDSDFHTGFFLQFQLKGLGGLGERTAAFLHRAIPGYDRGGAFQ